MQITLDLSSQQAEQFQQLAKALSIPPQELVQAAIDDFLSRPAEDFHRAARYVLEKNRELYRRLTLLRRLAMLSKVQKWGNSQGLRFTKAILQEAQINVGDEVNISVQKGRIIVEPATKVRGRYDLKELVSKMPKEYQAEELDWGEPSGKEVW